MNSQKDLIRAIEERHSVRAYTDEPIAAAIARELEAAVAEANAASGLHLQLVCGEEGAFSSLLAHYGRFRNVRNYLALVGPKGAELDELCGYFGEKVVLLAQQLGLNSCWVGGTFSRRKTRCEIGEGEKLVGVVALGHGVDAGRPSRSKQISELANTHGMVMPDWFQRGMQAAALAPTALNQQHADGPQPAALHLHARQGPGGRDRRDDRRTVLQGRLGHRGVPLRGGLGPCGRGVCRGAPGRPG